ncbi:MAG: hypothetical protein Q9183_003459, partial [Haloplaca sp. 2 TL-2023]
PSNIEMGWELRRAASLHMIGESRLDKFARITSMSDLQASLDGGDHSTLKAKLDKCSAWIKLAPFADLTALCTDEMDDNKQPLFWQIMAFILKIEEDEPDNSPLDNVLETLTATRGDAVTVTQNLKHSAPETRDSHVGVLTTCMAACDSYLGELVLFFTKGTLKVKVDQSGRDFARSFASGMRMPRVNN